MYCKLIGTNGPVTLYTPIKAASKVHVQCNADGSDILPPIEGTAVRVADEPEVVEAPKRKKKVAAIPEAPAVADYESGDDISFE